MGNFYLEGFANYGLGSSESIYWNNTSAETKPEEYTYSPLFVGGKLGFGIIAGTKMRITPEAGMGLIRLSGKPVDGKTTSFDPSVCSSISAVGGLKFSFALASCLELNLTPEYYYSVFKTDLYQALYDVSPTIVGWSEGLKVNVGIGLFF